MFLNMIYKYVYREYETLLDPSDPVFVDGDGVPMMNFRIARGLTDGHLKRTTHDGKLVTTFFWMIDEKFTTCKLHLGFSLSPSDITNLPLFGVS